MTTEELIKLCEARGLKVETPSQETTFRVIARYERGLGPEYVALPSVKAQTIAQAYKLAAQKAENWLIDKSDITIRQIRITPHETI